MSAAAVLLAGLCAPAAPAAVSSGDAAATRAYLRLDYAELHARTKGFPAAIAAAEKLDGRIGAQCPGVLAHEPKPSLEARLNRSEVEVREEEQEGMVGVAENTEAARRRRYAKAVAHLRWRDPALNRLVRIYATGEARVAALRPPDFCADAQAWVASGYRTAPPATLRYLHRRSAAEKSYEGAEHAIVRRLRRFESPADRRLLKQIFHYEEAGPPPALVEKLFAVIAKGNELLRGSAT